MSVIQMSKYRNGVRHVRHHETRSISIPVVIGETKNGFGIAISILNGGEILYFRSKEAFQTTYADAALHGKCVFAYAEDRIAVDTYEEAVQQLIDDKLTGF